MGGVVGVTGLAAAAQSDPVIARVNNHEIRESYVNTRIAKLSLGEQVSVRSNPAQFVESIVQEEVLFQSMLATDFSAQPDLREVVKALVVNHLIEQHVTQKLTVSAEEIADFYATNTSSIRGELVQVSQILVATSQQAAALKDKVEAGESFAALAARHSMHDESAANGGALGSFMNHAGPLGFETEVFRMQPGELAVFESDEGWHLVKVTERLIPALPPLENVAPRIRALLRRQKEIDALRDLMQRSHRHVDVVRNN